MFNGESKKWVRYVIDENRVSHVSLDNYVGYDSYVEKNLEKWRIIDIVRSEGDGIFKYRFHHWFYKEIKTGALLKLSTDYHMKVSGWFLDLLANFSSKNAGTGSCIGKKPKKYFY
ncbi:hypothetical protein MACH10_29590 [Thalassospira tepidiphila]|nr:hypothetical protein MACH10_29590 [Thalassospira tepidiphila]